MGGRVPEAREEQDKAGKLATGSRAVRVQRTRRGRVDRVLFSRQSSSLAGECCSQRKTVSKRTQNTMGLKKAGTRLTG